MSDLSGTAKTICEEVMDEIEEELQQSLDTLIAEAQLVKLISSIQEATHEGVVATINKYYADDMTTVKKLILGERLARIVTAVAKDELQKLMATILQNAFDVVDELRNEIIGEVFEETE